jgi:hypothetical protein
MIEVLKQVLEALKDVGVLTVREWQAVHKNKANELRQAIAELESQEPFCYVYKENGEDFFAPKDGYYPADAKPLYTHPPQRTEPKVCCQQYDTCLEPCTPRGAHLAQLEQEYDNSAVHLAHCYQGEYPICKYGDENCPAIPKVKAQQEQEPVAWVAEDVCEGQHIYGRPRKIWWECEKGVGTAFYTHPPQRTWVGMTDEEVRQMCGSVPSMKEAVREAEAKLKEKNT